MIYGLTGAKFSGKDTVGQAIITALAEKGHDAERLLFAGRLKQACCAMFGWTLDQLEDHDFKETPEPITGLTPRMIMQKMGTDFGRETLHPEIWLRLLMADIGTALDWGVTPVIMDVRFNNEAELLRGMGAKIIHVVNPAKGARVDFHASENGIEFKEGDFQFVNDKSAGLGPVQSFARTLVETTYTLKE